MDLLAEVTGSAVRADVLAIVYSSPDRGWSPGEVAHLSQRRSQVISREMRRLADLGFLKPGSKDRERLYRADMADPVVRELAGFVRQTRGSVPSIRQALSRLRSPVLAWIVGPRALRSSPVSVETSDLIVLTGAPRSLVQLQLAGTTGPSVNVHCMSMREWIVRLEKGDVLIRQVRRARKQWIVGGWEQLVQKERAQIEAARTLRAALSNWREDLSDEWDEDWDPSAARPNGQP